MRVRGVGRRASRAGEALTKAVIWNAFFLTSWSLQVSRQAARPWEGQDRKDQWRPPPPDMRAS